MTRGAKYRLKITLVGLPKSLSLCKFRFSVWSFSFLARVNSSNNKTTPEWKQLLWETSIKTLTKLSVNSTIFCCCWAEIGGKNRPKWMHLHLKDLLYQPVSLLYVAWWWWRRRRRRLKQQRRESELSQNVSIKKIKSNSYHMFNTKVMVLCFSSLSWQHWIITDNTAGVWVHSLVIDDFPLFIVFLSFFHLHFFHRTVYWLVARFYHCPVYSSEFPSALWPVCNIFLPCTRSDLSRLQQ